jgi:hypothetical protein
MGRERASPESSRKDFMRPKERGAPQPPIIAVFAALAVLSALCGAGCGSRPRDAEGQRLEPRQIQGGRRYEYRGLSFTLPASLEAEVRASSLSDINPDNPLPRRSFIEIRGKDGKPAIYLEVMKVSDIEAADPRPAGWKEFRSFLDSPGKAAPEASSLAGPTPPIPVFPAVEAQLASFGAFRRIETGTSRGFRFLPTFSQDGLGYRVTTRDLGYSYEGIVRGGDGADYFVCLAAHDCFAATPLDRWDPFPSDRAVAREENGEEPRLDETSPYLFPYLGELDRTLSEAGEDGYAPGLASFDAIALSVSVRRK